MLRGELDVVDRVSESLKDEDDALEYIDIKLGCVLKEGMQPTASISSVPDRRDSSELDEVPDDVETRLSVGCLQLGIEEPPYPDMS